MDTTKPLTDIMDFEHVIEVHDDGSITEPTGVYAPEVYWDDDGPTDAGDWTLMDGYSGQDRYAGPVMHASELIGGRMESDIRETPGLYVAIVIETLDDDDEPAGWAVAYRPS